MIILINNELICDRILRNKDFSIDCLKVFSDLNRQGFRSYACLKPEIHSASRPVRGIPNDMTFLPIAFPGYSNRGAFIVRIPVVEALRQIQGCVGLQRIFSCRITVQLVCLSVLCRIFPQKLYFFVNSNSINDFIVFSSLKLFF